MSRTSIQWTDHSVNPIRASIGGKVGHYCVKVSDGCKSCYSSRLQPRFGMPRFEKQHRAGTAPRSWPTEVFLDEKKLEEVLRRRKPTKYFWCDMTDMFGEWVPDEWIDKCWAVMNLTPQHTHQVLTKRPERMAEYLDGTVPHGHVLSRRMSAIIEAGDALPFPPDDQRKGVYQLAPPNIWLGTSAENQETFDERVPHLTSTPAAVHFLSLEPLLGPIDLRGWFPDPDPDPRGCRSAISLAIVGGESGPGARPCHVDWIRSIVQQCRAAKVACFVKQIGARPAGWCKSRLHLDIEDDADLVADFCDSWESGEGGHCGDRCCQLNDRKGGDPAEWPPDLRIREFPT